MDRLVDRLGQIVAAQSVLGPVHRAFGLPEAAVALLASLWVASFALTTLDTTNRLARYTWAELMARLGYARYGAQGGDWGSAVTTAIGVQAAGNCAGLHVNLVRAQGFGVLTPP